MNADKRRSTYRSLSTRSRDLRDASAAPRDRSASVRSLLLAGGRRLFALLAWALWTMLGAATEPLRRLASRQACHRRTKDGLLVFQPPMFFRIRLIFTSERKQRAQLLEWAQAQLPYFTVHNFSTCWADGITLCALMEALRPGCCPRYASLKPSQRVANCELGLRLACRYLRLPQGVVSPVEMSQSASDFKVYQLLLMIRHQAENARPQLTPQQQHQHQQQLNNQRRAFRQTAQSSASQQQVDNAIQKEDFDNRSSDDEDPMGHRATRQLVRQCSARGVGLQSAVVGRPAKFTIQLPTLSSAGTENAGGASVRLAIRGPQGSAFVLDRLPAYRSSSRLPKGGSYAAATPIGQEEPGNNVTVKLTYLSSDRLQLVWYPSTDGEHEVSVWYRGNHVNGSPFSVYARSADPLSQLNDLRLLDEGLGSANINKLRLQAARDHSVPSGSKLGASRYPQHGRTPVPGWD